jgi:hypothetical protein
MQNSRTSFTVLKFVMVALIGAGVFILILQNRPGRFGGVSDLELVDDHPLYVMHYDGDYGFDEYLKVGIQANTTATLQSINKSAWSCTCFAAMNPASETWFGRNFDWDNDPVLLLFTNPPDAFASVSMVDISYLGFGVEQPDEQDRLKLMEAPFLPFDGMNEYGVAIGMMAVPHAEGGNDPGRITIDSLGAIRLVLDYAKNVDEAITLLENYNIDFTAGPPLHYLIADSGGDSVVVEYLDHRMIVTPNSGDWQVATNFILTGMTPEQAKPLCWRYQTAFDTLSRTMGRVSRETSMTLLQDVSQGNTQWSVVYDLTSGEFQLVMDRNYSHPLNFKLELKTTE